MEKAAILGQLPEDLLQAIVTTTIQQDGAAWVYGALAGTCSDLRNMILWGPRAASIARFAVANCRWLWSDPELKDSAALSDTTVVMLVAQRARAYGEMRRYLGTVERHLEVVEYADDNKVLEVDGGELHWQIVMLFNLCRALNMNDDEYFCINISRELFVMNAEGGYPDDDDFDEGGLLGDPSNWARTSSLVSPAPSEFTDCKAACIGHEAEFTSILTCITKGSPHHGCLITFTNNLPELVYAGPDVLTCLRGAHKGCRKVEEVGFSLSEVKMLRRYYGDNGSSTLYGGNILDVYSTIQAWGRFGLSGGADALPEVTSGDRPGALTRQVMDEQSD